MRRPQMPECHRLPVSRRNIIAGERESVAICRNADGLQKIDQVAVFAYVGGEAEGEEGKMVMLRWSIHAWPR